MSRSAKALRAVAFVGICATSVQAQAGSQTGTQPPTRLPVATVVGESGKSVTVQNDRKTPVTLYLDAGRVDRAIGTVAAGATSTLPLPDWAVRGQKTVRMVARVDRDAKAIASYAVPLGEDRRYGLLIPPAEGLPLGDSMFVSLPVGAANTATVTIENQRDRSVTVYAEQGLMFMRLGEVDAKRSETLRVPESLTASKTPIRIFARLGGAAAVATQGLRVRQGDRLAIIVM
jgi:hypothetical protein